MKREQNPTQKSVGTKLARSASRRLYIAVPRFVRVTERQIDNTAEIKPLPQRIPER
jgi:hypothetical protein